MKLRHKSSLAVGMATAVTSLLVGSGVLAINFQAGTNAVQERLNTLVAEVEKSSEDKLLQAFALVRSQEVTLAYREADGSLTVLQEAAGPLDSEYLAKKWLNLGYGERLIFAISQRSLFETMQASLWLTLVLSLLAALASSLLTRSLLARDLNAIEKLTQLATRIAAGKQVDIIQPTASNELRDLAAALNAMVAQLKGSRDQMQTFLSDASHELRTPLTVIRGYLEMLAKPKALDAEQATRAIQRANASALRMQKLVNDLLQLAQLGEAPSFESRPIFVADIYQPLVEDLAAAQSKRKIEVVDNQKNAVALSEEHLTQFFTNAISNIRKHTPKNAPVRLTISQLDSGVQVVIEDGGPGLPAEAYADSNLNFRRFQQTGARSEDSSGLGLSIMAKLAELHQGSLHLQKSELGGLRLSATFFGSDENVVGHP